jgi:hypothetical protein
LFSCPCNCALDNWFRTEHATYVNLENVLSRKVLMVIKLFIKTFVVIVVIEKAKAVLNNAFTTLL